MACVRVSGILFAAMFLCMLLQSTFSDGHVIIVQHHLAQQTGPALTKAQESVIRVLEFLARLDPKYQSHLDSYLNHIGAARPPAPTTPIATTLRPQTIAPMTTAQPTTSAPLMTAQPTTAAPVATAQPLTAAPAVTTIQPALTSAPVTRAQPVTSVANTTQTVPLSTEEVEMEEITSPSSAFQTTASVTMTTEEVEAEEMTSPSNVMTTEEVEQEEATLPAGQTTSAEPPEEEEPEEIVLPLTQTFQCRRFEGVCMRQCESPADVIRGVSCGRDATGQALVCCDD